MKDSHRSRLSRRQMLGTLTAVGGAAIAACGSTSSPTEPSTSTNTGGTSTGGGTTTSGACAVIPSETRGPYPDRTGMINNSAFYRQDITEGRPGAPLTLALTVVQVSNARSTPCIPAGIRGVRRTSTSRCS